MDYEKKYKEALAKAKVIINDYEKRNLKELLFYAKEDLGVIFPELKESEDEEIKKPSDKVEPKFNVGDWVVRKDGQNFKNGSKFAQITKIRNLEHWLDTGTWANDESLRLWTIEDAKDGDILCTYECDEPKIVFTLKGTPKKPYALRYYSYYNIMYPRLVSYNDGGCLAPNVEDVKPATKEQRDILLQKLKSLEI